MVEDLVARLDVGRLLEDYLGWWRPCCWLWDAWLGRLQAGIAELVMAVRLAGNGAVLQHVTMEAIQNEGKVNSYLQSFPIPR